MAKPPGGKEEPKTKIDKLLCDKNVQVEEINGEPIPNAPLDHSAPPPRPSKPGAPPEKEEPKLTHIKFTERMQANNQRRVAIFYGNVELVMVQSQDFWGLADVVKYDEYEDRVIFEAEPGGLASLYRVRVAGQQPEPVTGRKITYWRKTGLFKVDDAHGLSVGN